MFTCLSSVHRWRFGSRTAAPRNASRTRSARNIRVLRCHPSSLTSQTTNSTSPPIWTWWRHIRSIRSRWRRQSRNPFTRTTPSAIRTRVRARCTFLPRTRTRSPHTWPEVVYNIPLLTKCSCRTRPPWMMSSLPPDRQRVRSLHSPRWQSRQTLMTCLRHRSRVLELATFTRECNLRTVATFY